MLKYLKSAFWLSPRVPLLGTLPFNPVMIVCFIILGFGHPGFWLLGLGAELLYLFGLVTNPRFRRLVDAIDSIHSKPAADEQRRKLVAALEPDAQHRWSSLQQKCERIVQVYKEVQADPFSAESNREALQRLQWTYLKLLVARSSLTAQDAQEVEITLQRQASALRADIADEKLSPTLRDSKHATLQLLERRAEMLRRKGESLQEIESDLLRVEAQVDLAMEKATIPGQQEKISTDLAFASQLLDDEIYGESVRAVSDLEQAYKQSA